MHARPWLPRPANPEAPDRVLPALLGPVAHQAMLRDGITLVVRGDLTIPADAAATPELRLASLAALVPARCVVGRQAALWVHTGAHEPQRVAVLVGPRVRRPDPHPGRTPHECELTDADVVSLGAGRATSVQRTGLDIARWFPADQAQELLGPLCDAGFDAASALRTIDALGGYAGVRDARATLARIASRQGLAARIEQARAWSIDPGPVRSGSIRPGSPDAQRLWPP
ncbi:MAG TPA: hypothetical protein VFW79_15320 [Cellulomonas sp.]|uniref:hypothetical protein n=1 Tax=Cellulomonas sp. TaxID=40001 RepID=UPI002E33B083|nr:hypothetical protein [Cellulomonas sp.]HEX5334007.1 hypothetical protein [Cellulomonas sp.]